MEKIRVEVIIGKGGETIQATIGGIKGSGCEFLSKKLSELGKVIKNKPTEEYYEDPCDAKVNSRVGLG